MKKLFSIINLITAILFYSNAQVHSLQTLARQNIAQQIRNYEVYNPEQKEIFNNRIINQYKKKDISLQFTSDIFNFKNQNFKLLDLRGITLWEADLEDTNFNKCNLQGADLQGGKLKGTTFNNTNLREVNLIGVNLEGVNFKGSSLQKVYLTETL